MPVFIYLTNSSLPRKLKSSRPVIEPSSWHQLLPLEIEVGTAVHTFDAVDAKADTTADETADATADEIIWSRLFWLFCVRLFCVILLSIADPCEVLQSSSIFSVSSPIFWADFSWPIRQWVTAGIPVIRIFVFAHAAVCGNRRPPAKQSIYGIEDPFGQRRKRLDWNIWDSRLKFSLINSPWKTSWAVSSLKIGVQAFGYNL